MMDMVLQTIIISVIGYVTVNLPLMWAYLKSYFERKKPQKMQVTITTTAKYVILEGTHRATYNSLYVAVMHAIRSELDKEISEVQMTDILDSDEDINMPQTGVVIKLSPDVNCMFSSDTIDGNMDNRYGSDTAGAPIKIQRITCVVYSTTLTIRQLRNFTGKLKEDYRHHQNELAARAQLIPTRHMYLYKKPLIVRKPENGPDKFTLKTTRCFDNVFFDQKAHLIAQLDFFTNNYAWYARTGTPHTLGICLSGPPGTGKTSCIKAIAKHTKRNVIMVSLKDLKTYEDVIAVFSGSGYGRTGNASSDIFVIEDIDCIGSDAVKKRDNSEPGYTIIDNIKDGKDKGASSSKRATVESVKQEVVKSDVDKLIDAEMEMATRFIPKLTLSDLLNAIDGVLEFDGRMLVITTNHLEALDPALIRPGRIDINIVLDRSSIAIIKQIIAHFFEIGDEQLAQVHFDDRVERYFTAAEITCLCKQYMTKSFTNVVDHLNSIVREND